MTRTIAQCLDIPFDFVHKTFGLNYGEWQIIKLGILGEMSLPELETQLHLTKRTIYQYRNNVKQKCGTKSLAFAGILIVSAFLQN